VPFAVLMAALLIAISELSYRQATLSLDQLGQMGKASIDIQVLLRALTDAETGERGYLLTGRREYLQPYAEGRRSAAASLAELRRYYAYSPETAKEIADLAAITEEKLSELATTLELYDKGEGDGWRELILSNIGKEKMDGVRALATRLVERESSRVEAGRQDVYRILVLGRIGISLMAALGVFGFIRYLRQSAELLARRAEQERIVRMERDALEVEVKLQRSAQIDDLARHLQTAREDERSRLARDLHDELGALLTAAKLDAARLKSRLSSTTPEIAERLAHLNEALSSGIALKRRIIEDLRPSSLTHLGLLATLDIQAREFGERAGLAVVCDLQPVQLSESADLTVYRLVQEAFTNIAKYAQAHNVTVSVQARDGVAHILVRDDGVGFNPDISKRAAHGLVGMRYRVETEGGALRVESRPGHGTCILATLQECKADNVAAG